ncbi:MAG TPA: hypothetical protein ENO23_11590 [Alphaproteobacteria bacterium]|nr:hypothetical protein [Alphaproteobacteria bacterium]
MSDQRWRVLGILAVLLLAGAVPARAQEDRRPAPRLESRLAPETVERLRAITERAERAGVPPELLRRKVSEGVSKGVTGTRLERAIEAYARRLEAARELAGHDLPPDVLAAAAEAAERGLPPDRIRAFLGANPNPLRAGVGLRALGELYEAGVPGGEAARGVNAALDRGMRGERLLALSAAVRRRVAAGEDPAAALRAEVDVRRGPVDARRPD